MAIIKCLLTIVLLFVIILSLTLQDSTAVNIKVTKNPYRLPKHVVPLQYDIKLVPYILENETIFTFDGEASIVLDVREPTYTITLHSFELTIDEPITKLWIYKTDGQQFVCCESIPLFATQHEYNIDTQMLTIHFDEELYPNKIYKLYLKFAGFNEEDMPGFYRTFYIDNEGHKISLAATFFQPFYARKTFPCWDEPAIKAKFNFSIKHYSNYTALSNMPSTRSEVDPIDGKLWTYFNLTPVMSTNILGFVITDYNYVTIEDGTTKVWGPKHELVQRANHSLNVIKQATRELEKFTKSTVHVPKMDHIAIPRYPALALESWGMIVYKEKVLIKEESLTYEPDNFITIVHELAHQWFGDLVSPTWWDYVWLSEGMSTYLSYYIADTIWKEFQFMDSFVAHNILLILSLDSDCSTAWKNICTPINLHIYELEDIYNAFSPDSYVKSAALLRMVSHFVRKDVFRNGLIKYLQKHKYSSVTPDDLWEALQDALDESNVPHDDFKVKEVMDTWFNQPAYPVVKIDRDYNNGKIKATQHKRVHFRNMIETENNTWWIPLSYITKSSLNSSSTLATHWLTPHDNGIIIEEVDINDWIIVNKQLTGYYRVNYDSINWNRIAAFLNSDDYDKIPILNRVQIVDDVYHMMETEELDFEIFLKVINYLRREIDLIPWYPALRIIQALATSYLQVPLGAKIFKPYFFDLTYKLFERIGFYEKDNDTSVTIDIRFEFIKFACLHDIHPECREIAFVNLLNYMRDPIANRILFDQKYICFGLMKANEHIWNQFIRMNEISTVVKFLGCSENLNIIERSFVILKDYYSCTALFGIMYENLPANVDVIPIIIRHYKDATAKLNNLSEVPGFVTIIYRKIIDHFNKDDIQKIKCIFKNRSLVFKNEYLNDRIQKLNKINDDLSNVLKENFYL